MGDGSRPQVGGQLKLFAEGKRVRVLEPHQAQMSRSTDIITWPNRGLINAAVAFQDCAFLGLVLLISLILYIHGLGFYSDDWAFLSALSHSGANSLTELFRALYAYENIRQRPLQALHLAWMYRLFGTDPLGYHLINSAVFIAAVSLFYLSLRDLRLPRLVLLTMPLVYGMLPHYSTDRFWVAAFQANVSMALYFASLYADLRALRTARARPWSWKLLSLACLLGSTLAYEVALPLFLFNAVMIWLHARALHIPVLSGSRERRSIGAMVGSNFVMLLLVLAYKATTTVRTGGIETGYASHLLDIFKQAVRVDYASLGIGLPYNAGKAVLRHHADSVVLVAGAVLGVAVLAYLYRAVAQSGDERHNAGVWLLVLALSPVVYFLGYAVFVTTSQFMLHKTGIANRISIAAAVGVAMTFTGGAGLACALLPSAWLRRSVFPSAIALLCVCGFLIINVNAKFWIAAYAEQRRVLADIHANITSLPAGSTLILDGVCPYIGSGIVFESSWDLAGALQIIYHDPTLRANVVTPKLRVGEGGLTTSMYGTPHHHRYGDDLLLYDLRRKTVHRLVDAETTRRYFAARKSDHSAECPEGIEGEGVTPF